MILERLDLTASEWHEHTGWEIKPEGACRDDRCVPLPGITADDDGRLDVRAIAARMQMPIAHDETHGLWALGPEGGGRVLASAQMPEVELPDFDGQPFAVSSLRGRKVLLVAWASW